ncbi:MAG: glutamate-1-semialdehyde 2,1-aminomutase [Armatimonadota bacterium]|nr:glutamate-1-semialdehyde 2,1-aminomutase [Armatimonadota bacterium]MDR7454129.1 glutamate-1-semialdehyde 2,1-aminomutase [Armatimonadota bacterium]MDR7456228.1 glutamate-1-semialdehyde 2,1-aminomutase [Armatimonadota bacterium]MDR7496904.1 glutamate-1-semialdehyde 2,1-aminomutase [Armatimonadota bacterium]MDR7512437.1 glutamate-1-semialdehyde 2,1-aminomutase [Armatimonadota bacterium]
MSRQDLAPSRSAAIFAESEGYFPGGVNSPVRAFRAVGGSPVVVREGRGAHVTDADGRRFLDYIGSWGAAILGHADPEVTEALREAAGRGTGFGMPTPYELDLARAVRAAMPSLERLRFVSSGTEAAMSALRVARGATGRDHVVKFAGCYHGHADHLLAQAGSGLATFGLPSSAGVPAATVGQTLVAPYNDLDAVRAILAAHPRRVAAVIVEPVAANMGVVAPRPGFLEGLRELTRADGALLVFDEVITGFRMGRGGAQARFGIAPDLTCLGKIVGGGLPVGVYGGRRDLMERVAPLGPVYQAGTLSGNPLTMAAGAATLRRLTDEAYAVLEARAARLAEGLADAARRAGAVATVVREASMLTVFFLPMAPRDYAEARGADVARYARFFRAMLDRGVLLPPSQFEAWFVSTAHTDDHVAATLAAADDAFRAAG